MIINRSVAAWAILGMGVVYGVIMFLIGLASSFTIGSIDVGLSFIGLLGGFLAVLPIAVVAIWRPRLSAILLSFSFCMIEYVGFADDGLRGVLLVAKRLAIPNIALIAGYIYVASTPASE